jgi:opacity protein-like surface antigen
MKLNRHLWLLAALPSLAAADPALAQYDAQYDAHSDWTYSDPQDTLRYRPWHFQIFGGPTATKQSAGTNLDNGWNAGAGFTWYPSKYLPLGLRADASYSKFGARQPLLDQAATAAGTSVDQGTLHQWGADFDGELDFPLGPRARFYLLAGIGWYKEQHSYSQNQVTEATLCNWWGCAPGYVTSETTVYKDNSGWQYARNAGLGLEFAMGQGASFFVDARYLRIGPSSKKYDFIPIRFGLRF